MQLSEGSTIGTESKTALRTAFVASAHNSDSGTSCTASFKDRICRCAPFPGHSAAMSNAAKKSSRFPHSLSASAICSFMGALPSFWARGLQRSLPPHRLWAVVQATGAIFGDIVNATSRAKASGPSLNMNDFASEHNFSGAMGANAVRAWRKTCGNCSHSAPKCKTDIIVGLSSQTLTASPIMSSSSPNASFCIAAHFSMELH
mmetsp:Transcript_98033/g.155027  ORF Transcript_98033/g.155027 Transcript_98033/m.155027 type:complete len:203 (-) Transcript_98033:1629-2237(-)